MTENIEEKPVKWFYIKSASSDTVISATGSSEEPLMRSQVNVCNPRFIDEERWSWDGQHLTNQATNLVLDIRKGRLRLIEDTDICIYSKKPEDEAHNQLWTVQQDDPTIPSYYICSQSNSGWVLDIRTDHQSGNRKLILSPHQTIDKENQLWIFISATEVKDTSNSNNKNNVNEEEEGERKETTYVEGNVDTSTCSNISTLVIRTSGDTPPHIITEAYHAGQSGSSGASLSRTLSQTSTSSSISDEVFPVYGLTPAKRGSQSSVTAGLTLNSFKECHQLVYLERNPHLSDKTIAMAAAYHVWQTLKEQQAERLTQPSGTAVINEEEEAAEKTRARLQSMAQDEASKIFDQSDQLNNHKETALALSKRLIITLSMMTPQSP